MKDFFGDEMAPDDPPETLKPWDGIPSPGEFASGDLIEYDLAALAVPSAADIVLRETGEGPPRRTQKPNSRYRHCPYCGHRDSAVIYWQPDVFKCFACGVVRNVRRDAVLAFDEQIRKAVAYVVGKYGAWARHRRVT
jgi:hypothetical protein